MKKTLPFVLTILAAVTSVAGAASLPFRIEPDLPLNLPAYGFFQTEKGQISWAAKSKGKVRATIRYRKERIVLLGTIRGEVVTSPSSMAFRVRLVSEEGTMIATIRREYVNDPPSVVRVYDSIEGTVSNPKRLHFRGKRFALSQPRAFITYDRW